MSSDEIAAATGLGRSTIGQALAALERAGWRAAARAARSADGGCLTTGQAERGRSSRLRGCVRELDGLVLEFVNAQGHGTPVGVTAVAKSLGRSAGAVGNCLARLATAGRLEQVSEHPRRPRVRPTISNGTSRPCDK